MVLINQTVPDVTQAIGKQDHIRSTGMSSILSANCGIVPALVTMYTNSSMTTIKKFRSGEHRANDDDF